MSKPTLSQWKNADELLMRFDTAWRNRGKAELEDFLPSSAAPDHEYVLRELVKIDLEYRWSTGERPSIEDYLDVYPELGNAGSVATELIACEFSIRYAHGDALSPDEVARRFPERAEQLMSLVRPPQPATETKGHADSSVPHRPLTRSQRLPQLGRYESRGVLGRGAFAIVYRAWDPQLRREVAVKVPRPELVGEEELRERMLREARAAARLQHPSIVPIHEVVDEDCLFIVSELIEGETLDQRSKRTKLSVEEAVDCVIQLARGLHYAHLNGIVHRDVKPANLILTPDNKVMITDFGLAQQADAGATLTRHGDVIGTPAYMSPEQASGLTHRVDARSDVYSAGVVLYRLISGTLPFKGGAAAVISQVPTARVAPPRQWQPSLSRDLETICLKCLEKDSIGRYQTASELADDLERFRTGEPITARRSGWTERGWKWCKRHPRLAATAALLLLAVGFLGGTAIQLGRVQSERDRALEAEDRARNAEADKTRLLADSYANAGTLAMQRGRFDEAIDFLDRSMEAGYDNPTALHLLSLDAHFVRRELDDCQQHLSELRRIAGESHGQGLMWQAELSLRTDGQQEQAAELFARALAGNLPADERAYVAGMLAENSAQAMDSFSDALGANPFHHRARTLLVNMFVATGRLGEATAQSRIGQQMFPEDPHFRLMEGLVLAVRGDVPGALDVTNEVTLEEGDRQAWHKTFHLMNTLLTVTTETRSLTPTIGSHLARLMLAEQEALSAVNDFGLRFPVPLTEKFAALAKVLAEDTGERFEPSIAPMIAELVRVHPEGTLLIWLGEFQIAAKELEAARDTFLLAVDTPSLLRDHSAAARLGVVATGTSLAWVHKREVKENLQHAADAVRGLDTNREFPANYTRIFMQVFLATTDVENCRTWLEKWSKQNGDNDPSVLWHRIELELMAQRYVKVVEVCEQVLEALPDDVHATQARKNALKLIEDTRGGVSSSEESRTR